MQDAVRLKLSRPRLRYLLLTLFVLAAAAGAGTGLYLWLRAGDGESVRVVTAVQVPYPDGWSELPLSADDGSAGILLNLERRGPEASFLARGVVAGLASDFDIDQLADDTEAALSAEIEGFDLQGKSVSQMGPYETVRITYRETESGGPVAHQVLMAIIPTPSQTFYLTLRAEKADFRQVEDEGLQMMEAIAVQIGASLQ